MKTIYEAEIKKKLITVVATFSLCKFDSTCQWNNILYCLYRSLMKPLVLVLVVRYFLYLSRCHQKYPIWVGSGLLRYILKLSTGCSSMHTLSCKACYKSEYFAFWNLYFDVCFGTGSRAEKSCKYHKLGCGTILECQVHLDQICMLINVLGTIFHDLFSGTVPGIVPRNGSRKLIMLALYVEGHLV